jgi:hypothetical protein
MIVQFYKIHILKKSTTDTCFFFKHLEQSDTEPDLTLDEIFAFSKRLKKYTIVKDDNFLGVAQDLNSKCETAILQRCL